MDQKEIYDSLEAIYAQHDPWHLENPETEKSFSYLLDLVKLVPLPHTSILEVGCAQGHFTHLLTTTSNDITGIDVSKTAIADAKKRLPQVNFVLSSLEDFSPNRQYDIIICSEVLYYIRDKQKAIKKLGNLGKYLVTSNFIADFPQFCMGSVMVEHALSKYPLLKRIYEHNLLKGELTIKSLRRLV